MKWVVLCGTIMLSACASKPEPIKPIVIDSKPIKRPNLTLPDIDTYNARQVKWIIVTPENVDEVFAELSRTGRPVVIFGLDEQGYENLSLNTRDSLRVILQQQSVIDGYREYYIIIDREISKQNSGK